MQKGDADQVFADNIAANRLRPVENFSSVVVRLLDHSRQGQMQEPAYAINPAAVKLPRYAAPSLPLTA